MGSAAVVIILCFWVFHNNGAFSRRPLLLYIMTRCCWPYDVVADVDSGAMRSAVSSVP